MLKVVKICFWDTFRVIVPVYAIAFVYFTVIAVLGCIYVQVSWIECLRECFQKLLTLKISLRIRYSLILLCIFNCSFGFYSYCRTILVSIVCHWVCAGSALRCRWCVHYQTSEWDQWFRLCAKSAETRLVEVYENPIFLACFVITTLLKTMNCFSQPDKKGAIKAFPRKASSQI